MPKKSKTNDTTKRVVEDRKRVRYTDQDVAIGTGGEVHQTASGDTAVLTTAAGHPRIR
jgi:hypothetical protein